MVEYTDMAWPTSDDTSLTFDGKINVLFVRANSLNAFTYFSATISEAAVLPSGSCNLIKWKLGIKSHEFYWELEINVRFANNL